VDIKNQINKNNNLGKNRDNVDRAVLSNVYKAIEEIRYGSIQIHIQDGKIVQIDKINKVRMG